MSYMDYLTSGVTKKYTFSEFREHARMSELRANDLKLLGFMALFVFVGAGVTQLLT